LSIVIFVTGYMGENLFTPFAHALYAVVRICAAVA
jgi:hypothetical protein